MGKKVKPADPLIQEFNKILREAQAQPGLTELLELYGTLEDGLKRAQEHLNVLEPLSHSTSSSSTSHT